MDAVARELALLLRTLFGWFILFSALAVVLFSVGFRDTQMWGTLLPVPTFESRSAALQIFEGIRKDLLPSNVQLVSLSPFAGFATQVSVALLSSFVLTLPILLYRIFSYLMPALHREERGVLLIVLVPAFVLFFSGAAFAYYFVIPATFSLLYDFAPELGAQPFFVVNEFLSTIAALMISVGLMFLLPVMMVFLAWLGLVQSSFWRVWWRQAALGFLVFAAFITPDGSGVTMVMLTGPMALLYAGGLTTASYIERRRISRLNH